MAISDFFRIFAAKIDNMDKNKVYTFDAEVVSRMGVRTIAICDSDLNKFGQTLTNELEIGDKLVMTITKK